MMSKILMFDENSETLVEKCSAFMSFWTKLSVFDKNFDFWRNFRFLTKLSIFDENFDFWQNFRFLNSDYLKKIRFRWIVRFWTKIPFFLTKISIFRKIQSRGIFLKIEIFVKKNGILVQNRTIHQKPNFHIIFRKF